MEYAERFLYQSNQWYNDGLKKANIHDMTGAIVALKKSLQYNRDNVAARNLLGLIYYGRGEVAEALVEWIISKNIKAHGNIATYYIKKVQESPSELEVINDAIKKYNQSLAYCEQGGEDLAAIQLRKVIATHPTFLKAYQLLTLIYIQSEQYAKARQMIRKAIKLDATNELTLQYLYELKRLHGEKAIQIKETKQQTVSYKLGNETIIQPVTTTVKEHVTKMSVLYGVLGLAVGAAVVWFLITPAVKKEVSNQANKEAIAYSEEIAALKSQKDLIQQELQKYKSESKKTKEEKKIAQNTKGSYEALVSAVEHYYEEGYSISELADELMAIDISPLGTVGKTTFEAISEAVYEEECTALYEAAEKNYGWASYAGVTERLERVRLMNEEFKDGEALLLLMKAYQKDEDEDKAEEIYKRIQKLFAETEILERATSFRVGDGDPAENTEDTTDTTDTTE